MRQIAKTASIIILCVVVIAIVDIVNVSRKEQRLSRSVKSIGGRTGSIPVWPFGTEYRVTLTAMPNDSQLEELTIANRLRGWVGIAFEDCDLSDTEVSRLLTALPDCHLFIVNGTGMIPFGSIRPEMGEPSNAPESRSRAFWQWKISRRDRVIANVIRHTPSGVRRISSHKRSLQPSIANWSFGFCVSESTRQTF
ncbi:hypothetical protein [Rubripirellula reticaptiva]|nr:hypothetical protein [Rubripirellula reticaptiva]